MKKKLLLEVHGALDDRQRGELETHLRECRTCRQEQERLVALLEEIRQGAEPPELSAAEVNAMVSAVRRRRKERPMGWFEKVWSAGRLRLIPVAAAASVALTAGLLAYHNFTSEGGFTEPVGRQKQLTQQDMEVIRHLDLLRNMDAIQKLVHIVDENGSGRPVDDPNGDMHGMPQSRGGVPYA